MPHTAVNAIDPKEFQRVLSRNVKLPLIGGLIGAVVFVGLIFYLLSVISWVEHTDRVTREASELQRLSVDLASWTVIEEAGGRFTDFAGTPTIYNGTALATNGLVHDTVVALLRRS